MSRKICVIGNTNIDLVLGTIPEWPEPGTEIFFERSDYRAGGSAANTALVLQRLGCRSGLVSAVGNDLQGEMLRTKFSGSLDRMTILDAPTGVSVGVLFDHADRTFLSVNGHLDKVDMDLVRTSLADWPLEGALVLVSGAFAMPALLDRQTELLNFLADKGAETAIDPGWPGDGWTDQSRELCHQWMARAGHILLNDKEAMGLSEREDLDTAIDTLTSWLAPGSRLVVKCGSRGAIAADASGGHQAPAPNTRPFDTIGAGDSFNAGYLAAIAEGLPAQQALERGTSVASRVIAEFPRSKEPIAQA